MTMIENIFKHDKFIHFISKQEQGVMVCTRLILKPWKISCTRIEKKIKIHRTEELACTSYFSQWSIQIIFKWTDRCIWDCKEIKYWWKLLLFQQTCDQLKAKDFTDISIGCNEASTYKENCISIKCQKNKFWSRFIEKLKY